MVTKASGDISCSMATGLNWQPQSPVVIFAIVWPHALIVTVASGDISRSMGTGLNMKPQSPEVIFPVVWPQALFGSHSRQW